MPQHGRFKAKVHQIRFTGLRPRPRWRNLQHSPLSWWEAVGVYKTLPQELYRPRPLGLRRWPWGPRFHPPQYPRAQHPYLKISSFRFLANNFLFWPPILFLKQVRRHHCHVIESSICIVRLLHTSAVIQMAYARVIIDPECHSTHLMVDPRLITCHYTAIYVTFSWWSIDTLHRFDAEAAVTRREKGVKRGKFCVSVEYNGYYGLLMLKCHCMLYRL